MFNKEELSPLDGRSFVSRITTLVFNRILPLGIPFPVRLLKKYIFVITALPDLSTFQAHSSQGSIFEYLFKINFTYHSSSISSYRAIALFDFQLQWLKTECK